MTIARDSTKLIVIDKHTVLSTIDYGGHSFALWPVPHQLFVPASTAFEANIAECHQGSLSQAQALHNRVGHSHFERIRKMLSFDAGKTVKFEPEFCTSCAIAKVHNLPYPSVARRQATRPLQMIGTDIVGPFPSSTRGYRYYYSFFDFHTSYGECYLSRHKKDHSYALKDFINRAENIHQPLKVSIVC